MSLLLTVAAIMIAVVSSQPPPPLRMSTAYGDHMILQQAPASANIWGYVTACDTKVTVNFAGSNLPAKVYTDSRGLCVWSITLPPTKADGTTKYTITATSDKYGSASISDVMFGDVWVCSGQSNMQFTVPSVFNAQDEIADAANYPLIRLFTASLKESTTPQNELLGIEQPWTIASPTSVGGGNWTYFSATCWFFGRETFKFLKYPIGLITTCWGGTRVEAWSSPDSLSKCNKSESKEITNQEKEGRNKAAEESKVGNQNDPSVLWNAMVVPFLNMTIKGAVWYQGESNAGNPESYNCTFPAMIDDWREKWFMSSNNQTTPLYFGFVQLAPTGNENKTVGGFPGIRWSQTAGYGYVPNDRMKDVFMAVAIDLGDPTSPFGSIHPRDKQDVGLRLSVGARSVVYGDSTAYYLGMLPQSASVSATSNNVTAVAVSFGPPDPQGKLELKYPYGFEIGCNDTSGKMPTQWVEGTAKSVSGSDVNVEFPLCPGNMKPVSIQYCWRTDPCTFKKCPVYTSEDTPSPPFTMDLK